MTTALKSAAYLFTTSCVLVRHTGVQSVGGAAGRNSGGWELLQETALLAGGGMGAALVGMVPSSTPGDHG